MMHGTQRGWLCILVVAGFALRVGYCAATAGLGQSPPDDYREYVVAGQRLLNHGTLVSPFIADDSITTPSDLMPPAYAFLVRTAYDLLGIESFVATLALQLVNAVSTSLAILFTFLIAQRISGSRAAWLAAIIATISPALFGFTGHIWDTSLFTLCATLSVWISLKLSDGVVAWYKWCGFGLMLGAIALLNPALTIIYPLLVLWPLRRADRLRPRVVAGSVGLAIAGWLIVITPWTVRNLVTCGDLSYIRGGFALELWLGVCPEADLAGGSVFQRQFPLKDPEVRERVERIGERAFIDECGQQATAAIAKDPVRYLRLSLVRFADYWLGSTFSHASSGQGGWPRSRARAAVMVFLALESALLLVGAWIHRRSNADIMWLSAIAASFSLVYCLTHVQVRYRAPMEAIVAVLAATALVQIWSRALSSRAGGKHRRGHVSP